MLIDSHLHVWRAAPDFPDPAATTVSSHCDVPVELLLGYMDELAIERAVIVQPVFPHEDNSYMVECCQKWPTRLAAVCVVDPNVAGAAERLRQWHSRGCRGLRLRPRMPSEESCFGDPKTFPLWEVADELNIVISVLANSEHIPSIAELARRFPRVTIVVDHLAHPDMSIAVQQQPILTLADCENVILKISGFPYYSRDDYPYRDCQPLVSEIYHRCGAARMIWGSDFPHILLQSGYQRSIHQLPRLLPSLTDEALNIIRYHNARRLYWSDSRGT